MTREVDLFASEDYKTYLNQILDHHGRGSRARLAKGIGCQTSYVAQVLRGSANLSLEQSEAANRFLGHNDDESQFFLTLVLLGKAGTPSLTKRFSRQLESLRKNRLLLKNRLGVSQPLKIEQQARYYSAWYYGAIHALISLPGFQSPEKIAKRMGIGIQQVNEAIEFLVTTNLIRRIKGGFEIGTASIHLLSDSPLISKHHSNWRIQSLQALDRPRESDLRYSSVMSLSEKDAHSIREILVKAIQSSKAVVKKSEPESLRVLLVDFFQPGSDDNIM